MPGGSALLLILAIVGVGVLHTMVPDHWAPIALLARQRGWSKGETARAAFQAGIGHVVTTLLFGLAVWLVGAAAAARYGHAVDLVASLALIGFGGWIAVGAWQELRHDAGHHHHGADHHHDMADHHHPHPHEDHDHHDHGWEHDALYAAATGTLVAERHMHPHRHGRGPAHSHWHDHGAASAHAITTETASLPPTHIHRHRTSDRTALLLVLGSSPMVEGIPAFFAASRYGLGFLAIMGAAFAASTIATYVALSVASASGLQRLRLGSIERYGEVVSGVFIALIGLAFGLLSVF